MALLGATAGWGAQGVRPVVNMRVGALQVTKYPSPSFPAGEGQAREGCWAHYGASTQASPSPRSWEQMEAAARKAVPVAAPDKLRGLSSLAEDFQAGLFYLPPW